MPATPPVTNSPASAPVAQGDAVPGRECPASSASAPPAADVGELRVPGYSRLVRIARGGDSVVYRAREDALGRDVALKVMAAVDPEAAARFRRELAITVELGRQHPNIVTVLATATASDGRPSLVMDFFELGSTHDRLTNTGPFGAAEVIAVGTAVADALAFAHQHGVLHRDVKPQNILVLPTTYVLSDFGIARPADLEHTATLDRFSYRYASPQVLDGLEPLPADDVWSLGATLFALLTGRPPFAGDNPDDDTALSYLRRVHTGRRRPLAGPPDLIAVIDRCLVHDRAARTITAAEVRDALASLGETAPGSPPSSAGSSDPKSTDPRSRPSPAISPSALAHVNQPEPPVDVDGEHTVARTIPAVATGVPTKPKPTRRRRNWTRPVSFVVGTLLVGGIIGVGGHLLGRDDDPSVGAGTGTVTVHDRSVPTTTRTPTGSTTGTTTGTTDLSEEIAGLSNPDLEPTGPVGVDNGSSITLSWNDESNGKAVTVVLDPTSPEPRALGQVAPGITTFRVEGVDPAAKRVCFVLVAIVKETQDRGVSQQFCPR